jgi:crossover junction endodeoxyribonuclease RuvC
MSSVKIAIDPGIKGAMAVRDSSGHVAVFKFTTESDMRDQVEQIKWKYQNSQVSHRITAVLEKVRSMPNQGVTSVFTFGSNYGYWRGILQANRISFREVRPQEWQKGLIPAKLKGKENQPNRKRHLKQLAQERYPDIKVTLDTADALLMLDNA